MAKFRPHLQNIDNHENNRNNDNANSHRDNYNINHPPAPLVGAPGCEISGTSVRVQLPVSGYRISDLGSPFAIGDWRLGAPKTSAVNHNEPCSLIFDHHVGAMLAHLGAMLAHLGSMLAQLGPMLAHLGAMLAQLGAMLAHLGPMLAYLGPMLAHLDANLAQLGANMAQHRPNMASMSRSRRQKTLKKQWFL